MYTAPVALRLCDVRTQAMTDKKIIHVIVVCFEICPLNVGKPFFRFDKLLSPVPTTKNSLPNSKEGGGEDDAVSLENLKQKFF